MQSHGLLEHITVLKRDIWANIYLNIHIDSIGGTIQTRSFLERSVLVSRRHQRHQARFSDRHVKFIAIYKNRNKYLRGQLHILQL